MKNIFIITFSALMAATFACDRVTEMQGTEVAVSEYLLSQDEIPEYEADVDHKSLIEELKTWDDNWKFRNTATTIYRSTCYSCHGNNEQPGSLPNSKKFWKEMFKNGNDPYSLYQTITRGFGQMPPQPHLVPQQKYAVIAFIREVLVKPHNESEYFEIDSAYLASLPVGDTMGPEPRPYHPWSDMDYGNWLIRCYEMSDDNDPPKQISGGRAPLPNEDYSKVNFAYKGIAMRLDPGPGGIAAGNTFAMFDHDLLRFVGAWTGEGFIDWEDILLDDQHNVYPRTVGKRQFANPITPGWANPKSGSFRDPRFLGSDGRPFGPLPREWAHYKGLYRHDDRIVIKYTVGTSEVLESYDLVEDGEDPVIARTLNLSRAKNGLKLRVAPAEVSVSVKGNNVSLAKENGFQVVTVSEAGTANFTVFMSRQHQAAVDAIAKNTSTTSDLSIYTNGSPKKYPQVLTSPIIGGNEQDPYAVDVMVLPQVNPWKSRMRPTGIDFDKGGSEAVVSTIDGEVWRVRGLLGKGGEATTWQRIATGMFQPLGIKIQNGDIYVTCRDQIVILRDLNGDGETDFYESFNSDHQVTEHFHEFAMGLQTDAEGNFYYAKSGRHARTSLVPQHGTLIKVSPDGKTSEILANGFRAANGVCLNPDGSFYVTDQQGYWNPMNRINRVTKGGFYGNMWGYGAPEDTSDAAMIQPMSWIDMSYDRS
ncbi:MAG: c-type cytochrome, partial [Saprospiraceae bacterium]|nr:c-type cytochrome [Saprospiraceae bacterium]